MFSASSAVGCGWSMAFSIWRCASALGHAAPLYEQPLGPVHKAYLSIFSSTVAWRSSMRRRRSRVAHRTRRLWRTTCAGQASGWS